ncbi:[FeFe] hydrogenase H-cluster maturation GTPase HydF [Roseburia sp. BX1005]|uniref:[FeFe] hydrogenase H-cluster maturation GTPase HydF n=1 Tax=Roseburia zhanii TaxID=2763064 RepID=A0A923LQD2_9FIRM|nr:[FeFe] hydrogenase H-cluster maturation GTPase HydF [Roseburia zhanii]MBC5714341.1 [FeFe] hydrogenase H-cluster maturation GTPase HydF [Roseburia zhanii]
MGMNETPSSERIHIGIFGRRNAGKSSVINAVTGQSLAIVSDIKGTTTDPVLKAMELLPLGPVVMVDTPGLDDEGELGKKRIEKSYQVLNKTDIAVLVIDAKSCLDAGAEENLSSVEKPLIECFVDKKIPYVIAVNKSEDLTEKEKEQILALFTGEKNLLFVSAEKKEHIYELKEKIASLADTEEMTLKIVGDLLETGDIAVLVVPIDSAAPKGRLILPQQQVIRDCLEAGAIPVVTRETELKEALLALGKKPKLVITDSQAFERVAKDTPEDVYLTSFSILFSRYKGDLKQQVEGAKAIRTLKDQDTVLISEGCTHHRQCGDIGTEKLPNWIRKFTGKELQFEFTSGTEFPRDLSKYALIIHCGGCTLNEREMKHRLKCAKEQDVPMTNYGVAIADMHGILDRSLEVFA